VRVEVVAVGTELLLGQVVDTNSAWLGEQLAAVGIDCHYQTRVGDNVERIAHALRAALARSDAVVVCGGLGPTQDDCTREALAEVLGVELRRDPVLAARIEELLAARGRALVARELNLRQADVPEGAVPIPQRLGTAPGLLCRVGAKACYALPGVPHELKEMFTRAVLPDLLARSGESAVIRSRALRTWGLAESRVAEVLAPRVAALGASARPGVPTIAFLASGMEGITVRLTVKAPDEAAARAALEEEEARVRALLGEYVFGVDDETMEAVVGRALSARGETLAVAESLTGGLVVSRVVAVPGASAWFRGGLVAYATELKERLLGVPEGPVVSAAAAAAMAEGVRRLLGAGCGLATTGVAGPTEQDGQPVGTVFLGVALGEAPAEAVELHLPGDRERVRQYAAVSALDLLRRRLR
jgi:nicotinamide-nucleotide amidase